MPIDRCPGTTFPETVSWLVDLFKIDRQTATHLVWDQCYKIGTDRHYYIDIERAHRYLADR
jgi:hypothetical protein